MEHDSNFELWIQLCKATFHLSRYRMTCFPHAREENWSTWHSSVLHHRCVFTFGSYLMCAQCAVCNTARVLLLAGSSCCWDINPGEDSQCFKVAKPVAVTMTVRFLVSPQAAGACWLVLDVLGNRVVAARNTSPVGNAANLGEVLSDRVCADVHGQVQVTVPPLANAVANSPVYLLPAPNPHADGSLAR
jgi:hypothetical protein